MVVVESSFEEMRSTIFLIIFAIDYADFIENAKIFDIIRNYTWVSSISDLHNHSDSNQKQARFWQSNN